MMFAGHTSEDGRVQPLCAHLKCVAHIAADFARPFGADAVAYQLGLGHDIGKYAEAAQDRLLRGGRKVDHATAGAQTLNPLVGPFGAYPVMGHHGGLPDGGSPADTEGMYTYYARLKKELRPYDAYRTEITLAAPSVLPIKPLGRGGFSASMLIRMLHSCLVDADFLDTEHFMKNGAVQRGGYNDIPTLLARLEAHLASFGEPSNELNRMRNAILYQCCSAAEGGQGLYSLTVPTGGGKTLSSMAFALKHAARHGMARVIYVIPYTSIIEQNAAVFADILGASNVLEHHSGVEYDEDDEEATRRQLAAENWDAPVVVTSNVQFFESLFANKPSKCRKLHNITNSVLIFDEAQMLPIPYLQPCVRAIAELVHGFNCTAVLCTATQPVLDGLLPPEVRRTEICRDPAGLNAFFRRTNIQRLGCVSDDELAARLSTERQALCIVNTRKQAQVLYKLLGSEDAFHLSTLMYPEHRKAALKTIRARLNAGLPCRVVSTSLIEAGVDVDFPAVYRAEAGLDSVIQAAGRCNREGRRPASEGRVYVFEAGEGYAMPASQRMPVETFRMTAAAYGDLTALAAIHTYFQTLLTLKGNEALDQNGIVARFEDGWYKKGGSLPFKSVAKEFKLIETDTYAVLIPIEEDAADLARRLRAGERDRALMQRAGRYSVSIYEHHYQDLNRMGITEPLGDHLAILADTTSYDAGTGLALTPTGGKALFVEV